MLYSRMTLVKTHKKTKDESKMNKHNNFLCPSKTWYEIRKKTWGKNKGLQATHIKQDSVL